MHDDLLTRGGTCVTFWVTEAIDPGNRDGRIANLAVPDGATAEAVIDAAGLHVLPGLIDSHVRLRDPGEPAVETTGTGTRAAVLGGITTLFDMPNAVPPIADAERLAWTRDFVAARSWCDTGLYVAGTKGNIDALAALEREPRVCAVMDFFCVGPSPTRTRSGLRTRSEES